MAPGERRVPLPGLTALRFFAASYVLLYHLYQVRLPEVPHPNLLQTIVSAGYTGVTCFFVLSGFILAYTHPQVKDVRRFYRARFARIYPLYVFALLLMLPNFLRTVKLSGPAWRLWAIPADLTLLQAWIPPLALDLNTPAWTLSCEAFFYLLFPWLISQRWIRTKHPIRLLLLLCILQPLPTVIGVWIIGSHHPAYLSLASDITFLPIFRLGEFIAGMVLGLMFLDRSERSRNDPQSLHKPWLLPAGLLTSIALLSLNFRIPAEVTRNGLLTGPFCLILWALATGKSRLLASRALQLGGEISYGVYLLQVPFSHLAFTVLRHTLLRLIANPAVDFRPLMILVYPFAWITYLLIEKPCRNWLLGRTPHASKPIPTPQASLP